MHEVLTFQRKEDAKITIGKQGPRLLKTKVGNMYTKGTYFTCHIKYWHGPNTPLITAGSDCHYILY